jgi:hypothetical protein
VTFESFVATDGKQSPSKYLDSDHRSPITLPLSLKSIVIHTRTVLDLNCDKLSFTRIVAVFLLGILLFGTTGCKSWKQTIQAVDGETGQPIGDVKITWISAHRRFMDYTRSLKEYRTSADGKALLKHPRNDHPFNELIFEHPKYYDAAVAVSEGPRGLEFRLNTPAPISNLPWLRLPGEKARTNATNVVPLITKDYEAVAVLRVVMFPRQ